MLGSIAVGIKLVLHVCCMSVLYVATLCRLFPTPSLLLYIIRRCIDFFPVLLSPPTLLVLNTLGDGVGGAGGVGAGGRVIGAGRVSSAFYTLLALYVKVYVLNGHCILIGRHRMDLYGLLLKVYRTRSYRCWCFCWCYVLLLLVLCVVVIGAGRVGCWCCLDDGRWYLSTIETCCCVRNGTGNTPPSPPAPLRPSTNQPYVIKKAEITTKQQSSDLQTWYRL